LPRLFGNSIVVLIYLRLSKDIGHRFSCFALWLWEPALLLVLRACEHPGLVLKLLAIRPVLGIAVDRSLVQLVFETKLPNRVDSLLPD